MKKILVALFVVCATGCTAMPEVQEAPKQASAPVPKEKNLLHEFSIETQCLAYPMALKGCHWKT